MDSTVCARVRSRYKAAREREIPVDRDGTRSELVARVAGFSRERARARRDIRRVPVVLSLRLGVETIGDGDEIVLAHRDRLSRRLGRARAGRAKNREGLFHRVGGGGGVERDVGDVGEHFLRRVFVREYRVRNALDV